MSELTRRCNTLNKSKRKLWLSKNSPYLMMAIPGFVWMIVMHYVPVFGIVLAFKKFNYVSGIFGSEWVGLKNFEAFFKSNDCWRILRNTIGYNFAGMLLVNILFAAIVALLLFDITKKGWNKLFQTSLLIPYFISWVAIAYIAFLFLSPSSGILNSLLSSLGIDTVNWYNESKFWPFILMIVSLWKNVGFASLYYYSALLSIDTALFEAAEIDGAKKFKQIWYISIPELIPMICMTLVMKMGNIIRGGMDLFYQIPMNSSALYSTTDTIATYLYRGLVGGSVGVSTAVGLFQSAIGIIMLISTNSIIKRISPERTVF